jgi:hypothetical protein
MAYYKPYADGPYYIDLILKPMIAPRIFYRADRYETHYALVDEATDQFFGYSIRDDDGLLFGALVENVRDGTPEQMFRSGWSELTLKEYAKLLCS